MDYASMGKCIRGYRKQNRLTQAELAAKVGISTSFMGHIERGSRIASLETMIKLSETLGVTLDALVAGGDAAPYNAGGAPQRMRMLNDLLRVLSDHADEWLREE